MDVCVNCLKKLWGFDRILSAYSVSNVEASRPIWLHLAMFIRHACCYNTDLIDRMHAGWTTSGKSCRVKREPAPAKYHAGWARKGSNREKASMDNSNIYIFLTFHQQMKKNKLSMFNSNENTAGIIQIKMTSFSCYKMTSFRRFKMKKLDLHHASELFWAWCQQNAPSC